VGKVLVLLIVAAVLYFLLKGLGKPKRPRPDREAPKVAAERIVSCSQCGLHIPESEATGEAGRFFCSEEHRRAFHP
jgi:uncharacterized protein